MTLQQFLPKEFCDLDAAWQFKDEPVFEQYKGYNKRWPGKHRYVMHWCSLQNGYAVGWNENPCRGWSFPVVKLKG